MKKKCVLMFSGGRDSTLAALELQRNGFELLLVTVTSNHLIGGERVRRRLRELKHHLPSATQWINVVQPRSPIMIPIGFSDRTCLPCQQAYVLAGYKVLQEDSCHDLALGYASYQSDWPEQTPAATSRLKSVLDKRGVTLHLPVYHIRTKELALRRLADANLSTESLEQKCTKQVTNITLEGAALTEQLDLWESLLTRSLDEVSSVVLTRSHTARLEEI
ncbi:hypothetical protein RHDC3_02634 [Rhodocyclaceae bacterium]|nr:hypothetical protein RHDC3_02634 [Rhodocyclaceae bacterium]